MKRNQREDALRSVRKIEAMIRSYLAVRVERVLLTSWFEAMGRLAHAQTGIGEGELCATVGKRWPSCVCMLALVLLDRHRAEPDVEPYAAELERFAGCVDRSDPTDYARVGIELAVELAREKLRALMPLPEGDGV